MSDLFSTIRPPAASAYSAQDIQVLEGLEPVRHRPGMYIGGVDSRAMHHLVVEIVDNAMDEAVAGHASRIEVNLDAEGWVTVTDNGRGIPIDPHPKFPDRSALEVILTTLHSGGKFSGKVYETSGGLHGVGLSVVNALSDTLVVEVVRERNLWRQEYKKGVPQGPVVHVGSMPNRRGTKIAFKPDRTIFDSSLRFEPGTIYRMLRSKAYLFRGVEIHWQCDPELLSSASTIPAKDKLCFPGGLEEFLQQTLDGRATITPQAFIGLGELPEQQGRVEWALAWPEDEEGFISTYCNTVPTPQGGTHEQGVRQAIIRGLRSYGELVGNKKAASLTADDALSGGVLLLSLFYKNPQFQGQTKEKLVNPEVTRLVEGALKDHFDHWLAASPDDASKLLDFALGKMEERLSRKQAKETQRASATRRLRLPGKLIDCSATGQEGTEIFLVEGDSAGGTAKQARDRTTQAVLPLRGKILNVASASLDKLMANQEIADLALALGCGMGKSFDLGRLRYQRVIIMTDADVDGAHIASLLMTFFYKEMRPLIEHGHLFLSQPPLYRLTVGKETYYALDDIEKEQLLKKFGNKKVEISRFKGLGEMPARLLKETTMDISKRSLLRVVLRPEEEEGGSSLVERLMGKKAEERFLFIRENAVFAKNLDV